MLFSCWYDCRQADEESGGPEAKYASAYEARVNPFTDFQKNEMEARVSTSNHKCCYINLDYNQGCRGSSCSLAPLPSLLV